MQYTENYQFRKPVIGVDDADVKDINFNSDRADTLIHNTQISLAPAYDLNETYDTGDVVMYETLMYKCKADNTTGAWDASKWERTTAGEEGAGGGGGSSVVPNPQGTPTDTLNTIGIDGTIFDIAGGGGGGGSAPHKLYTKLYNGNITSTGDVTLLDSIENYDFIMIEIAYLEGEGNPVCGSTIADVPYLKSTYNNATSIWVDGGNNDRSVKVAFSDGTTMKVQKASTHDAIIGVYGLKLEVGNLGKGAHIDLLWDYVNDNSGNIYWSGNALTLNGDIRNYDEVVVEIVSAQGDVVDQWKSSYQWRLLVDPLINSFEPCTFTICSYDQRSAKFQFTNTTLQKLLGKASENGVIRVYGVTYGGGAGGNGGRTEDVLFEKPYLTANPNTITLNHAFTDYDEIQFWTVKKDDSSYYDYLPINIMPVEYLTDVMAGTISGRTNVINISGWQPQSQYLRIRVTSASELAIVVNNSSLLIRKIVGIKY